MTTAAPNHHNRYTNVKRGRRADLDNIYFDSAWEANIARYLRWLMRQGLIKAWQREGRTFIFPGVTRGAVQYTPDFMVTETDNSIVWWEVKGYETGRDRTKWKRFKKNYPQETLIVIDGPAYRAIAKYKNLIEGWE